MANLLLGIDVGTSSTKCVLIDDEGRQVGVAENPYSFDTPNPGWVEQDPQSWWLAAIASIRQVLERSSADPSRVAGIGLTGQMHGLVLLDDAGLVLRPCILWNDQRSAPQCERLEGDLGRDRILSLTGNRLLPGFTAPKIAWVREHEPELWSRTRRILLPKDYLRYRLSGAFRTESSDASGMLLFDCEKRRWSAEMLGALGVTAEQLPECREGTDASVRLSSEAAALTGLPEGTPIAGGGGDQAAQAIGTGTVGEGTVSVTLGTSGVVFAASRSFRSTRDGSLHAFCHAVPDRWHLMGVMLSAAGSLSWFAESLALDAKRTALETHADLYEILCAEAASVPEGCDGVTFLPYLSGERTPHPDPHARGVFAGLSTRHRRPHLVRAVLEGVTFGLVDNLDLVRSAGVQVAEVRLTGGGARSPFWRQLCADAFGVPVLTVNAAAGAAFGAALIAGAATAVFTSVDDACARCVRETSRVEPSARRGSLDVPLDRYRSLYPALRPWFNSGA
ncbi:MAG: xylulokinase [Phycisphaerae bacterium]|nr:xylulokinase [Phycisphaerae bacterium]